MTLTKLLKFGTGYGGYDKEVAQLQMMLKELGYYTGKIDGQFGSLTLEAVKRFQKDNNLLVDGIVGNQTWTRLVSVYNAYKKAPYVVNDTGDIIRPPYVNTALELETKADNSTLLILAGLGFGLWYFLNKK